MPSGPKKRKAAKRKKILGLININNNNSNNNNNDDNNNNNNVSEVSTSDVAVNSHSQGKEDLTHGGHKGTDGGEVSNSASQDHQFNDREGTREKQLEISHSESSIDKNKSNALGKGSNEANKVAIEWGGIVQVERESKLEGESLSPNINIESVEPARFPHGGELRRRSSSSSTPAMSKDIVQVAPSASDVDIVAGHSVGLSEKENEKRELGVVDEKTTASDVFIDRGLEKSDSKTVATSDTKISVPLRDVASDVFADRGLEKSDNKSVATSDTKISMLLRDDDKLDVSYDPPAVDASVHADDMNDSPHQPLVASGPRTAETTSWKSCCGLFEAFAGSNK